MPNPNKRVKPSKESTRISKLSKKTAETTTLSPAEWVSYEAARERARRAAKRPHPFARAHEMLRQSAEKRKRKRDKRD